MAHITHASTTASDGVSLRAHTWTPDHTVNARVVVIHGIRDHGMRYAALAESLCAQGIAVTAQDLRGHGESGGPRQLFSSIDQLMADSSIAVGALSETHPGVPIFLYGHSLGGLVAAHMALAAPKQYQGVILSGPALKLLPGVSGVQQKLAKIVGRILPQVPVQPVNDSEFVREAAAKAELAADPLIVHTKLPAASARATLRGLEAIQQKLTEFDTPLLIMHGSIDVATNIAGSHDLVARARNADKKLHVWDGLAHDLLHEPERDQVIDVATNWIRQRI
ncbi:MAG: lysophospholipase [Actinomycetota bacterium]